MPFLCILEKIDILIDPMESLKLYRYNYCFIELKFLFCKLNVKNDPSKLKFFY
jgi:hypothetical protein